MKTHSAFRIGALVAALATSALAGGVARAATTGTLNFYGGQVVTQPKIVMVYVGNWDNSTKSQNAQAELERFYTSIGGTRYFGTLSGYHDKNGAYVQNVPIKIINRLYYNDTSNPMNAAKVNAWLAPYIAAADQQTVFIQVPYAGIATSCGGGAAGCRGNFYTKTAPYYVPTGIISAFDSAGNFRPDFAAGIWLHELVEAMLDSMGDGWGVSDSTGTGWDIADVCDYPNSPWYTGSVPMRTTWQNDPFTEDAYATTQFNATAMSFCSHAYTTHANVFGVGQYPYHLYHQHVNATASVANDPWNDWGTLGASGYLNGGPAVASWGPGRMDVFNFDTDYNLRHGYVDASVPSCANEYGTPCVDNWGGPPFAIKFLYEPAVASPGMGRYDVYAIGQVGANHVLFQRIWDSGSDTGWISRGGPGVQIASGPAVASYVSGADDIFVIGTDNNVYRGHWDGTTMSWTRWIASQTYNGSTVVWQGKPAVASWLPGRFDVMLIDTQGRLFDCGGDRGTAWGNCSYWTPPPHVTFTYSPGITALGDNRLLVAARGSDGQGWMEEWNNGQNTGGWRPTGGALAGAQVGVGSY